MAINCIPVQMIANGAIQDGKTIMLLQYAALAGLAALRLTGSLK
jgi:hypothetical protein